MMERSAKQAQRAQKTQSAAETKAVREMLAAHGWLAPHFLKLGNELLQTGVPQLMPGGARPKAPPKVSPGKALPAIEDAPRSSTDMPALKDAPDADTTSRKQSMPISTVDGVSPEVCKSLAKPLHRQYGTILGLPQCDLRHLLTFIEPSCLHPFALRGVASTPNAKNASKADLCKVIEFCTGLPSDTSLNGTWRTMRELAEFMSQQNSGRGRPVLQLRFPLTADVWLSHGVYKIEAVSDEAFQVLNTIQHRHATVQFAELGLDPDRFSEMFIEQNWSEQRAVLLQKGMPIRAVLMMIFPKVIAGSTGAASASHGSKYITPEKVRRADSGSSVEPSAKRVRVEPETPTPDMSVQEADSDKELDLGSHEPASSEVAPVPAEEQAVCDEDAFVPLEPAASQSGENQALE